MTVAENIVLGIEPGSRAGARPQRAPRRASAPSPRSSGWRSIPRARVETLSVGQQQRVELLKALYREARLLILDEPTAVLSPQAVTDLFAHPARHARAGEDDRHHHPQALRGAGDLRRGDGDARRPRRRAPQDGRDQRRRAGAPDGGARRAAAGDQAARRSRASGARACAASRWRARTASAGWTASPSRCAPGRSSGIAGVEGNGQTELIEALAGLVDRRSRRPARSSWAARTSPPLSARGPQGAGDRPRPRGPPPARPAARLRPRGERHPRRRRPAAGRGRPGPLVARPRGDLAGARRRSSRPSTCGRRTSRLPARALSGGNQQKLILGREFELPPRLLLVAQPTRGVDIGAIEFIHRRLVELRDAGCAILLVSSELEEVTALSDRLLGDAPGADRGRGGSGADLDRGDRTADDRRRGGGLTG